MRKYINIPLPVELANQIDNVIKISQLGYKTKSEFVKEAVREKLIELSKLNGFKKGRGFFSDLDKNLKALDRRILKKE